VDVKQIDQDEDDDVRTRSVAEEQAVSRENIYNGTFGS